MKKFFVWFYYLSKRQIKNIFFLLMLLILPVLGLYINKTASSFNINVAIGVYDDDKSNLSLKFIDNLKSLDGIVNFIEYPSEDSLENAVLKGEIQCGYSLMKNFEKKLKNASYNNLISVTKTPEGSIAALSNELMFSKLFTDLGYYTMINDLDNSNVFSNVSDEELDTLKENYYSNMTNGRTFHFNYSTANGVFIASGNIDALTYIETPIRGIISIFIFISALAGGFTYLKDKKNAFKHTLHLYDIMIPVFFSTISCIATLITCGIFGNIMTELCTIILYSAVVILFVYILSSIINNSAIYCSTIPIFSLGSIVCCPVFFNLSNLLPFMKVVQLFFMPTYYFLFSGVISF